MKNKIRVIFGYLFSFVTILLIVSLSLLFIFKYTVFKKSYIENILIKNNYYTDVYNDIYSDMEDYMMSSGLPEDILNGIFSEKELKKDINTFLNNIYLGKKTVLDTSYIKERLNKNIDDYLKSNNVEVTNDTDLDSFVDELIKIYNNQVCLYKTIDSFVGLVSKASNMLNKAIIICSVSLLIVALITIILLKVKYIDSILIGSGIILLFIRFLIYEKIDVENIIIVSNNFSKVLKSILIKIGNIIFNYAIIFIIVGLLLTFIVYFTMKRRNMLEKK